MGLRVNPGSEADPGKREKLKKKEKSTMSKTKKLSKVLALVIMLALVIGILPMGAMASTTPVYVRFFNGATQIGTTVSVTASDNTAYTAITAAITSLGSSVITSSSVTPFGVHSINGYDPGSTDSELDAWLYIVDDKLADDSICNVAVSEGSVVTVFYTTDYTKTKFAYILPDGAATSGSAIAAGSSDTFKYRVATSTVDFNDLYSTILSGDHQSSGSVNYIEETPTETNITIIPAYKRVVSSSDTILANWRTATQAAYTALTQNQKAELDDDADLAAIVTAGNASDANMSAVNALAYIVAPYTRENSTKLNRLYFTQGTGTDTEYLRLRKSTTYKDGFDPDVTSYSLEPVNEGFTLHYAALGTGTSVNVSTSSGMTVSGSDVSFTSSAASGDYTLTLTVSKSGFTNTVYTITVPYSKNATGSTNPSFVNGYLPAGQYATGAGWGSVYTSYNNVNGNSHNDDPTTVTDAYTKTTTGYVATGVSLGSPGGYIQMQFSSAIENKATNPYGIDFVVYGNPFKGNPEAGSVKVSTNGTDWYELAGSRYYNTETMRNTTISYKMIPTSTYGSDGKANIYYAIGTPPTGTGITGWTLYKSNVTWWPEAVSEGYGRVSGVPQILDGSENVNDVVYQQLDETSNGYNCWIITYKHVTLVKDTDNTDDYLFGYADIRHVGNTRNGTACNPYASLPSTGTSSMVGGDGFDISWAVDENGEPVSLSSINYIRIYTSAALSPNNLSIMPTPGVFGETSTEVNGVYVASGSGAGSTTDVSGATLTVTGVSSPSLSSTITSANTFNVDAETEITVTFSSSGNYVFVNGETGTGSASLHITLEDGDAQIIRVIAKDSTTGLPYIGYMKLVGVRP